MDRKDMYLESKQAVADLVSVANQDTWIPACPDWRIRDVVAHLVGQLEDIATGNTEGGGTDNWTAAQVDRFRDDDIEDILAAWNQAIIDAGIKADDILRMIVPDLITHEYDIRGSLGNSRNRKHPALRETADNFISFQEDEFIESGLPAVRFMMDDRQSIMGNGEPELELKASAFEVTRAIFGRRSRKQILELDWNTDPSPWLDHILITPPRETDLVE